MSGEELGVGLVLEGISVEGEEQVGVVEGISISFVYDFAVLLAFYIFSPATWPCTREMLLIFFFSTMLQACGDVLCWDLLCCMLIL